MSGAGAAPVPPPAALLLAGVGWDELPGSALPPLQYPDKNF